MQSESNNGYLLEDLNTIPGNCSVSNGLPVGANIDYFRRNIDLNAAYLGNENLVIGLDRYVCPSKPGGSETDGQSGLSSDEWCQSCKRKTPETASGQLSLGGLLNSVQQSENFKLQAAAAQDNTLMINYSNSQSEQLNPGYEFGGVGAATGIHRNSCEEGNEVIFQRNTRPRIFNVELMRAPTGTLVRNSHVQSPIQLPALDSSNYSLGSKSAAVADNTAPQSSSLMHPPNSSQIVCPSSWNWTTRLRSNGESASSSLAVHVLEAESSRQAEIRGSLAQNPTNVNRINGIANFARNVASSSGSLQLSSRPWSPLICLAEQYDQNLSESLHSSIANSAGMQSSYHPPNPSTESIGIQDSYHPPLNPGAVAYEGQTSYGPVHPNVAAITPEMVESATVASTMPPAPHYTPVFDPIPIQPANALPHPVEPVTTETIRNRGRTILDNSNFYGDPNSDNMDDDDEEGPDAHEEMRLDVDSMSYEELLALEEHIGYVNTGLTEENILAHLKRQIYKSFKLEIPVEEEPCCICREDYLNDEELGKLDCGHDFHFNCIKQWLVVKNSCPICKLTALGT